MLIGFFLCEKYRSESPLLNTLNSLLGQSILTQWLSWAILRNFALKKGRKTLNDSKLQIKTVNMITRTMTSDEVIRALQKNHSVILDRMDGLGIKNSKKLKNKLVKDNAIMSRSDYVLPGTYDSAVVYAIKHIQTLRGKEYSTMLLMYYYKTSFNTYIVPNVSPRNNRVMGYMEFTLHSIDRMKMRLGKDFDTFFQEDYLKNNGIVQTLEYHFNGDKNERVAHIGDAFVILECEDDFHKYVVKTILSNEELYASQMMNKLNSKRQGEAVWREVDNHMISVAESNLKECMKAGILRTVA